MKMNIKKTISISLATLITVGSTGIYAASFNDISGHWAKTYIEKGKNAGLIEGVGNGRFEPQDNLTRIQAIILSSRLLNSSQDDINKSVVKYKATLLRHGLPEWTIDGISLALSKGIVDENILTKLISSNGAQVSSSREEVAIFLTRAIGLEKEAKSKGSNITLKFKDANDITESAKPYILVMNEKKIMDGDDKGNFNPLAPIKRGEMAKVLNESYEYLQSNPKKNDDLITVLGTIQNIFSAGDKRYIYVRDTAGTEKNYEVNNQSVLKRRQDSIIF